MTKNTNANRKPVEPVTNEPVTDGGAPITPIVPDADPAPAPAAVVVDPFADVPVIALDDDTTVQDLTDVVGSPAYKYTERDAAARAERSPMLKNYKHGDKVLIPGNNHKELRAGSVYSDIRAIVQSFGRAGVPVVKVITELRKKQIGNKRSKYCESLPPIGWAEGWLDTAITKGFVNIHATKTAPSRRVEAAPEAEQKKIANG